MKYDYIVIGGGSAGCAAAARLAEDTDTKVLLLESGRNDRSWMIHLPVGFYKYATSGLTWDFESEKELSADYRRMPFPQARVLGGGSSINAMVYVRGAPEDFNSWASEHKCEGWSWDEVAPFFRRSEGNETFGGKHHGLDGPLRVSHADTLLPLTKAFLLACQENGLNYNPDFNAGELRGCGPFQRTVSKGRRCSSAVAFLRNPRTRRNLTVQTNSTVHKILIENNVAVGVRVEKKGAIQDIRAEREVILAAGSIGSPKVLMLSGVGSAEELREHGIVPIADLKGVGKNLQEHTLLATIWELGGAYSYDKYKNPLKRIFPALQYAVSRSGPVATNIVEAGGFFASDNSDGVPDVEFLLTLGTLEAGLKNGVTMSSFPCRPNSRGTVRLRSSSPKDNPRIKFNFFSDPSDMECQIAGLRFCQEVMAQKALEPFGVRPHLPSFRSGSKLELTDYVRKYAYPGLHPAGTCKMGVDEWSVVDPQLRVYGVDRLRVCDASVMPRLISTNTNATAIMIGERCANFIQGNRAVPPLS